MYRGSGSGYSDGISEVLHVNDTALYTEGLAHIAICNEGLVQVTVINIK